MGIEGNEIVDKLAKDSSSAQLLPLLNHFDVKLSFKKFLYSMWDSRWKDLELNKFKLREIKDTIFSWQSSNRKTHREEVVITRLRIGHSLLTHSFLMSRDDPPSCPFCLSNPLTIKHLLLLCTSVTLVSLRNNNVCLLNTQSF
uniref:RNase H type-1 domain-containing protein n=1 Tax=Cacopsylla melanoneura TaxID=428564 RepID=A0A8D8R086_9HEMI